MWSWLCSIDYKSKRVSRNRLRKTKPLSPKYTEVIFIRILHKIQPPQTQKRKGQARPRCYGYSHPPHARRFGSLLQIKRSSSSRYNRKPLIRRLTDREIERNTGCNTHVHPPVGEDRYNNRLYKIHHTRNIQQFHKSISTFQHRSPVSLISSKNAIGIILLITQTRR